MKFMKSQQKLLSLIKMLNSLLSDFSVSKSALDHFFLLSRKLWTWHWKPPNFFSLSNDTKTQTLTDCGKTQMKECTQNHAANYTIINI